MKEVCFKTGKKCFETGNEAWTFVINFEINHRRRNKTKRWCHYQCKYCSQIHLSTMQNTLPLRIKYMIDEKKRLLKRQKRESLTPRLSPSDMQTDTLGKV